MGATPGSKSASPAGSRLVMAGGFIFGLGFGGLADGIVLHHILQWHNLITDVETNETLEGLRRNLFWDGVFHATTALLTIVGLILLWHGRDTPTRLVRSGTSLVGLVAMGWGAFHVVDQLLFHLLLDLHDIREGAAHPALYNWSFFAVGVVLLVAGGQLVRRERARR